MTDPDQDPARPPRTFLAHVDIDVIVEAIADRLDRVYAEAGVQRTRAEAIHDAKNIATVVSCREVPRPRLSPQHRETLLQMIAAERLACMSPNHGARDRAVARLAVLEDLLAALKLLAG